MEEPQLQNSESPELYFVAYLEKGLYDLTYGENANFGILTARKDELPEDAEITMENATAYPASSLLEETKSYCRFSASIKDLSADLYEVEFVARAYVAVGDTVHYSEQISGSVVQVAEKILEKNEDADDVAVAEAALAKYKAYSANNRLIVYPEYPEQIARDYEYSVTVEQGSKSEDLVVYNQTEAFFYQDRFDGGDVNRRFCEFAFSGASVTVHVKVNRDFDTYAVVPTSKGFASTYADGVISVTLKKPEQFVIILDDDVNTALSVFADARETEVPQKNYPNTIYVEGWNQITFNETGAKLENGILKIRKEGVQLYIAPGAVLTARVETTESSTGFKIFGRGALLDPASLIYHESEHGFDNATSESRHFVKIHGYSSVIKDVKLLDARCYNLNINRGGCTVQNVKILSSMMTTDGITTTAENGTVKDCFVYCGDNALVPQVNSAAGYTGYSFNNITVGTSCSVIYPQYGVNSTFTNIYVFRADEGLISMKEESVSENHIKRITVKNLDALDCVRTPRLFYAAKQGSAEKTITLNKVLMRYTTGTPSSSVAPGTSTNEKTLIAFESGAGSNFKIDATDLYIGGTLITNKNQIRVSGSASHTLKFTKAAATPSVLSGSRFVANYSYKSKVMLGSRQLFLNVKPVKDGDTWYLPYGEIASYLAVAPQNPITTQIDGVEMISLSNLLASGAVTAASYKSGAIRLTPTVRSTVNLFVDDYRSSSNYDRLDYRSRTTYIVADKENGEWFYTAEAAKDDGGIFRMILDEYKTYGKGTYVLKFDYKASTSSLLLGVGVDHNETKYMKSVSGASLSEWKSATVKFEFTDDPSTVEQMALWFWGSSGGTISLKNISLTKTG